MFAPPEIRVIKKRNEIINILHNGKRIKTRYGNIYLYKTGHTEKKMAVLIKKHVGNSVSRNYRKRIVREYIRKHINSVLPYNEIIFLYNFVGDVSYNLIESEFSDRLEIK